MFSTASAVWSLNDVIILFSTCAFKLIFLVADKSDDKVRTDCARMRRASVGVHAYEDIFLKVPHSHNRNPYAHFKKMYLLVLALLFIINIIRRSHSRCFGGGFKLWLGFLWRVWKGWKRICISGGEWSYRNGSDRASASSRSSPWAAWWFRPISASAQVSTPKTSIDGQVYFASPHPEEFFNILRQRPDDSTNRPRVAVAKSCNRDAANPFSDISLFPRSRRQVFSLFVLWILIL